MQQLPRKVMIGPSILSADFAFLFKECQEMVEAGAQTLHIDIMDGYSFIHVGISFPILLSEHLSSPHFGNTFLRRILTAILWWPTQGITFSHWLKQELIALPSTIRQITKA